ncbi:MAG: hypothetical protein HY606_12275 [Planctomycetes bacterium]|nr:hypothetical protein [Planctomycetota bacterium]
MRHAIFSFFLLAICANAFQIKKDKIGPEVWMCGAVNQDLIDESKWDFVRKNLDVLQFYINWVDECRMDKLKEIVAVLNSNNIKISIECGGTVEFMPLDDTNGERSAELAINACNKIKRAGGTVSYLTLDGPIRRLLYPQESIGKDAKGFDSVDQCVDELIDFMKEVLKELPEIKFILLTNFPCWGYKGDVSYQAQGAKKQDYGDYYDIITAVVKKTKKAGVKFLALTVDNPYEYAVGEHESANIPDPSKIDWIGRLRDLENYIKKQGWEFNMIFNSEKGGFTSSKLFYKNTLKFIKKYQTAGGAPNRYIIQSWYKYPDKTVPEDEQYTLTNLVREVIKRIKK